MINKEILESAITERITTQLFGSIVNECFVKALPLDISHMTPEEDRDLKQYTMAVVQSIGGIKALENAVDFVNKTPRQNLFLGELYDACMEGAANARKKTADALDRDPEVTLKSAVDKASLSEAEYKDFAKKKDDLDLDKVSEIIKNKTIKVIKDEQDQYEKEKELDTELNDCITSGKDEKNQSDPDEEENAKQDAIPEEGDDKAEAKNVTKNTDKATEDLDADGEGTQESYLDMYLQKFDPRHHVTVFSRLQESAMEALNNTKVRHKEDYFPIVNKITFESFLWEVEAPALKSDAAMEATQRIAREEVCSVDSQEKPKMATLVSIIVYTMMETLKTMGVFSPSQDNIRKFVDKTYSSDECDMRSATEKMVSAKKVVKEAALMDFTKKNSMDLSNEILKLKEANESMDKLFHENSNEMGIIDIVVESNRYINEINDILQQRLTDKQKSLSATESFMTQRQKENDLAQFNRIHAMFKSNPNVSKIILDVNPNHVASIVDVKCANESGNIVATSYMNIEYACEGNQYLEYLNNIYQKSNLFTSPKEVIIHIMDGKGKKVVL